MTQERISTGAWWDPETWAWARSAYIADLDLDPSAPAGFNEWIGWVIERHAARGPKGRAKLGIPQRGALVANNEANRNDPAVTVGLNRHHPLRPPTRDLLEKAIVEDRRHGRVLSRSVWIHEAVTVAIQEAKERAGGHLELVDERLPNKPSKPQRG